MYIPAAFSDRLFNLQLSSTNKCNNDKQNNYIKQSQTHTHTSICNYKFNDF